MKKVAIGIDIGGTNTAIGIVDEAGVVVVKDSMSTPAHGDVTKYIDDLSKVVFNLIDDAENLDCKLDVVGIGIGAPNANYYSGTIEHAPNLSFTGVVPFVEILKSKFKGMRAIVLTNDANAATLGEMIYGGAKGMRNFVMYTLGTGVGSGIVVDGNLVYGNDGFAGECGHTMLVPKGRLCGCGVNGHLETYCSATGMKRTAFELLAYYNCIDSPLAKTSYNELTSKMIYDAAVAGDKVAKEVFEITGKYLGQGIADTVHHLSPEAIFLFGGPVASGELLLSPTRQSLEDLLLPTFKGKIRILPSLLRGGDAAVIGASALVWKETEI